MLKTSQLMRVDVYTPKRGRDADVQELERRDLSVVGKVHQFVFAPSGKQVVGLLVRRPDVAGMVHREDAFVALDSFDVGSLGLVVTRPKDGMDDAARERLGLDWDRCILWAGMDAKTTDGKELGWVSDIEFSPKTGNVKSFHVGDGAVAKSLVGNVEIPADMLRGYRDGYMLVDPEAATLALNGGLAARAGESYARAKLEGKEVANKAGKAAGEAVEKGAYGLGRALGKAKRAVEKEGDPAKAVGKQVKRTRGMFGSFMDEFKKASK